VKTLGSGHGITIGGNPASIMNPGAETMPDIELLALIIERHAQPQEAHDMARGLLLRFGSIRGILNAQVNDLLAVDGMCQRRASIVSGLSEISTRYLQERMVPGSSIQSPGDSRQYLMARLRDRPQEVFCALFLDNRHRVLSFEELFFGTIDATTVYPREILRRALTRNAAAVILAHNHPSGVAEPSAADQNITRRVRDALALIDVRLLDHFVVGDDSCVSLAARGML
jgi:DNA repair protein RadC